MEQHHGYADEFILKLLIVTDYAVCVAEGAARGGMFKGTMPYALVPVKLVSLVWR